MPSLPPSYRMLPGSSEGPYRPVESQDGGESITFRQVLAGSPLHFPDRTPGSR